MSRVLSVIVGLMFGAPARVLTWALTWAVTWALTWAPAWALTGDAPPAAPWAARPIVMIVDARNDLCTGTAISRDLVLTAAHCVVRRVDYTIKPYQTGVPIPVRAIVSPVPYSVDARTGYHAGWRTAGARP